MKRAAPISENDPAAIVTALAQRVEQLRRAQQPDEYITVTMRDMLLTIGLQPSELQAEQLRLVENLCWLALRMLGFKSGTRGKDPMTRKLNIVLRLPAQPHPLAACASQCSAAPATAQQTSTELAELDHTGPARTTTTQRRLAAEKRGRSGHLPT